MKIIRSIKEMKALSDELRVSGKKIGLVATMGYLHDGHLSLVDIARKKSDIVIMSIFVNPTQFAPTEDFDRYPRDLERDTELAEKRGVEIIFHPRQREMYPGNYCTFVKVENLSSVLCGTSRPIHFRGVTTVVSKLFHIVKPHVAVFGQKDIQQFIIIKRMVDDLNMDVEVEMGPIVREKDGLAMSSRNVYLSPAERKQAVILYQSLKHADKMHREGEIDAEKIKSEMVDLIQSQPDADIDYVEIVSPRNLQPVKVVTAGTLIALAIRFGSTRLIDNLIIGGELER